MADSADGLLARLRAAAAEWTAAPVYSSQRDEVAGALIEDFRRLDFLLGSGAPPPSAWGPPGALAAQIAGKDAEIDRLTAELDAIRDVPVEYVPSAGLEAAMAVTGREDGATIRTTDGKREAYVWKAAAREWEKAPGDTPAT